MIKVTTMKASFCVTALLLSLSIGVTVKAETRASDTGIAGISPVLDTYYGITSKQKTGEPEVYMETLTKQVVAMSVTGTTEVVSPYANLGISIANDYVNIRSEANTESDVVGKLYRGCATDIIKTEGDWVKIHSGKVDGYIKAEYLAIGKDAEDLIKEFATKYATVTTETLFVREGKSKDTAITTMVPFGETYYILNEFDDWVEIQIDDGDGEEGGETGFVSKDYIDIEVKFQYAISIEEEQAKLAAEEAARQAESERLEKLALQQEEQRKAAEKEKAESAAEKTEATRNESSSSTSNSESKSSTSESKSSTNVSKSSNSSTGQEIADYAVKFVGNPYVWGGTSLTGGADCSGFVQSVYSHFGYGITRTSRDQSASAGDEVSLSNLQAGDLIYYCNSSGTVNHVAMYIGGGKVVHASNPREGIKISSYNYRTPYKARRII